jgi:hypothetical protein
VIEEVRAACAALAEHGITISAEDFARDLRAGRRRYIARPLSGGEGAWRRA